MRKKKRNAAILIIITILMTVVLHGGSALADKTGVVKGGWLILRAAPTFSGKIRSSLRPP